MKRLIKCSFNQFNLTRKKVVIGLLVLCSVILGSHLITKNQSRVDAVDDGFNSEQINQLIDAAHLKGSLLLIKDKKVIYTNSYGYADEEKKQKNTPDTLYPMASIQKRMTALMIGQLVGEGKLNYDDVLADFYPTIPHADQVTVRELLDHRSGYMTPEVPATEVLMTEEAQLNNVIANTTYSDRHNYAYSNGNYAYLAAIISKLDNQTYEESLKKRVLEPLKMENTYFWNDLPENQLVAKEYKYQEADYGTENLVYSKELMSTLLGAGNLYTTVNDLARYELALEEGVILSQKAQDELFQRNGLWSSRMKGISGNISSDILGLGGYNSLIYGDEGNEAVIIWLSNQMPMTSRDGLIQDIYRELKK